MSSTPYSPSFTEIAINLTAMSRNLADPPRDPLNEKSPNVNVQKALKNADVSGGKKRKSDLMVDDIELPLGHPFEWTADRVRSMIRQFINSGEMKVGEFTDKIDVSGTSYHRFMGQNGPDKGMGSDVYAKAAEYFTKREMAGLGLPRANKKSKTSKELDDDKNTHEDDDKENTHKHAVSGNRNKTSTSKKSAPSATKTQKQLAEETSSKNDISDIHLEHEDAGSLIPVFDTCDDMRTKINRHQRETAGASNAGFVREVNKALPSDGSVQPATARHLTTFLNGKGHVKGCESPVFYASYVWFEKLRVKQGKPKSKKRLEMEDVWGPGGMRLDDWTKRGLIVIGNEKPHTDKYGKVSFGRR